MARVKCKTSNGCGCEYEIDEEKVIEEYIQCPFCQKISRNPFYQG